MGTTNFEAFRQKMEKAKAKKSSFTSAFTWMKLDAGKRYTLRFLPLKSEKLELPIAIYHHHAITFPDGHFESLACPKKTEDGDCPFCNHASKLYRQFTKTEKLEYKEAAKALFVKTHYLLAGFEPSLIDPTAIKPEDIKIVRASSKSNMDLIETKLQKEVDFVDFKTGRCVDLLKTKGSGKDAITSVLWDFGDPSVAFDGKDGKAIWDELLEKSPDLTPITQPLSPEKLQEKFAEFMSAPVATEEDDAEVDRNALMASVAKPKQVVKQSETTEDLPFDIEDMRHALEDN